MKSKRRAFTLALDLPDGCDTAMMSEFVYNAITERIQRMGSDTVFFQQNLSPALWAGGTIPTSADQIQPNSASLPAQPRDADSPAAAVNSGGASPTAFDSYVPWNENRSPLGPEVPLLTPAHDALCGCSACFIRKMDGAGDSIVINDIDDTETIFKKIRDEFVRTVGTRISLDLKNEDLLTLMALLCHSASTAQVCSELKHARSKSAAYYIALHDAIERFMYNVIPRSVVES